AVGTPNSVNDNDKTGLIMLGCACKDELGIAHRHCAEAWFKIKGNRDLYGLLGPIWFEKIVSLDVLI
ncbi:hypothetical protein A2U01_0035100, partial [Trifolium medium]|nr:hypothetical protein [Trifolium medium]